MIKISNSDSANVEELCKWATDLCKTIILLISHLFGILQILLFTLPTILAKRKQRLDWKRKGRQFRNVFDLAYSSG